MIEPDNTKICRIGILDYTRFSEQLAPIVERARGKNSSKAIDEMRQFVANIKDREKRELAMTQLERVNVATQSNRWHPSAAGQVLEASCVEEERDVPHLLAETRLWVDFLYDWDEDAAGTIHRFFNFLADHTLEWASPNDIWRATVAPDVAAATAEAMGGMTPRQLRKHLLASEDGEAFDEEEAETISEWWGQIRSALRMAKRLEHGLLISVIDDE